MWSIAEEYEILEKVQNIYKGFYGNFKCVAEDMGEFVSSRFDTLNKLVAGYSCINVVT